MAPRLNTWTEKRQLPEFISALFAFEQPPVDASELAPFDAVLAKAQELAGDDDPELTAAVARAQAHQMAACFIRQARESAGLSNQELAQRLGVSAAYLSDAQSFRSSRKVPLDLLVRVAHACNAGGVVVEFQDKCDPKRRAGAIASFRSRIKRASTRKSTSK